MNLKMNSESVKIKEKLSEIYPVPEQMQITSRLAHLYSEFCSLSLCAKQLESDDLLQQSEITKKWLDTLIKTMQYLNLSVSIKPNETGALVAASTWSQGILAPWTINNKPYLSWPNYTVPAFMLGAISYCCGHFLSQKQLTSALPELLFLAGITCNIGGGVLQYFFPPEFSLLSRLHSQQKGKALPELEQQILGMGNAHILYQLGHARVGAWLLSDWQLPAECITVADCHHKQLLGRRHEDYCLIVTAANQYLSLHGLGDAAGQVWALERIQSLGVSRQWLDDCRGKLILEAENIEPADISL